MSVIRSGFSALGKLLIALSLGVAFFAGMLGIVYIQLRGEEVSIPKVVGKNFNDGRSDLTDMGLRIKKIATRYSNEKPNTILEQRPRAGTTAKSGLMISVVVSEKNPEGNELPVDIKDDEEAIEEIQDQPELKIEKKKSKTKKKKTTPKNRDVITKKDEEKPEENSADGTKVGSENAKTDGQPNNKPVTKPAETKPAGPKPPTVSKPAVPKPKPKTTNKPKPAPDSRNRKVQISNEKER